MNGRSARWLRHASPLSAWVRSGCLSWLLALVVGPGCWLGPPDWRASFRRSDGGTAPGPPHRRCASWRRSKPQGRAVSERNIVVLLPGILDGLVAQHVERTANAPSRRARQDHFGYIAAFCRRERIGEAVLVLLDPL